MRTHFGMKAHSVTIAIKCSLSYHTHNLPGSLKSRQKWPDVARSFLWILGVNLCTYPSIHVSNTLLSFSFTCRIERSYIIYKAFLPVEGHTQLLPYTSAVSATHKRGGGGQQGQQSKTATCMYCVHARKGSSLRSPRKHFRACKIPKSVPPDPSHNPYCPGPLQSYRWTWGVILKVGMRKWEMGNEEMRKWEEDTLHFTSANYWCFVTAVTKTEKKVNVHPLSLIESSSLPYAMAFMASCSASM